MIVSLIKPTESVGPTLLCSAEATTLSHPITQFFQHIPSYTPTQPATMSCQWEPKIRRKIATMMTPFSLLGISAIRFEISQGKAANMSQ